MAYLEINRFSASGTVADGATITINHDQLSNLVPLVCANKQNENWGSALVANFTSTTTADTGQTASLFGDAAISGGWLVLDGASDYLTYPDSSAYTLGTSDFTIEFELALDSTGQQHIVNHAGPGELYAWAFMVVGGGIKVFASESSNRDVLNDVVLVASPSTGQTYKIALVRSGDVFSGYVDGSRVFNETHTGASLLNPSSAMVFGRPSSVAAEYLDGKIRRFRFTPGEAKYTGSSYTPPGSDFSIETTYSVLAPGVDFSAEINSARTQTTITNISGASYDATFTIYEINR